MKVQFEVTRKTFYAAIVEMDEKKFKSLSDALYSPERLVRRDAEKEINKLVKDEDWQDDDLLDIEEFVEFKEESNP